MEIKAKSLVSLLMEFDTEQKCIDYFAQVRWPHGVRCLRCGGPHIYNRNDGQFRCGDCAYTFSVRKGTAFEGSNISLQKWLATSWLVTNSPKGISSYQLARTIDVSQKTAWRMLKRLRAVAENDTINQEPLQGEVEVDEVYMGGREKWKHFNKKNPTARGGSGKLPVVGIRSREGDVRYEHIGFVNLQALHGFVERHAEEGSTLYTDENVGYNGLGKKYDHHTINHSRKKYVDGDTHVNGIESMWALLRRGYHGTFHHWTQRYMHLYLAEFAFRQNTKSLEPSGKLRRFIRSAEGVRVKVSRNGKT